MEWIADPQAWIALVTLTFLEIVLGIDNIIFISILAGKLPQEQQAQGRQVGLALAMITRILLGWAWYFSMTQASAAPVVIWKNRPLAWTTRVP